MLTVLFILLLILIIIRKLTGKKGTSTKFTNNFLNWKETYPQAFESRAYNSIPKESKGEKRCRKYLENYFSLPFKKQRPKFLSNPITNGSLLELDCFNEELELAVEYQGEQHYKYIPHFHKSHDSFLNQKYRDQLKRDLCRKNNIHLIEVPYYIDNIEAFLKTQIKSWTVKRLNDERFNQNPKKYLNYSKRKKSF